MATPQPDVFAALRTGNPAPAVAPGQEGPRDVFAPLRPAGLNGPLPEIRRANNTLGEEFRAGLGQGIDSLQGSLYGVAALTGRELGINWLEDAGMKGAEENFSDAAAATRQSAGFTDIDSAGGFFRWAAASLGEAIPSLGFAITGGGIGGTVAKKSVEMGVKRSLARRTERDLVNRFGFDKGAALESARELMNSTTGQKMLAEAFVGRKGKIVNAALARATPRGVAAGAAAVAALPQIGAIDQELLSAGVADPGLTALLGGILGGALEAIPAIRLMDKLFPGIDRQVSKQFVKDFAVATGTQLALEGTTEAAQEMIQLAALAYHDPSFDMFSPDAKKRVIDAFAAGALVGAVTGGAAEAIGNIAPAARVAKPKIDKWVMDTGVVAKTAAATVAAKAEEQLPEGFVAADNTVFEEIRGRVYGAVQPAIESAVNSMRNKFQGVVDILDDNLEGGVNPETAKFSQVVAAAHNKFITDHKQQIADAKEYLDKQAKFIAETAEQIKDPATRAKFIDDNVASVKEKLSGFVERLRRAAAKRDQTIEAEVDNMEFDESIFEGLDLTVDEEGNVVADDRNAPEGGLPQPGEVDSPVTLTFGKNQKTPAVGVSGKEDVKGYDSRAQAELGLETLRKQFPESTDQDFEIIERGPDDFTVESVNPELRTTQRFNQAFQAARDSAARTKRNDRNDRRKFKYPLDGKKFGFKFESAEVDIITLALRGKNIDPNATSLQDGLQAMVGDMIARGYIDNDSANQLLEKFNENFNDVADTTIEDFAPVGSFVTEGAAKREMIDFINTLKKRGVRVPFNLINTRENDDSTFGYGIDDPVKFRALRTKSPKQTNVIVEALANQRRQDFLAEESRREREFSGNVVVEDGGDIADPRGNLAGPARVESDPIRTGRVEGERDAGRQRTGQTIPGTKVQTAATQDTQPQADDRATDPSNLPSEQDTVNQVHDDVSQRRTRRANQNAREVSEEDRRILKIIARPAKVKVLFGGDAHTDGALTKAVKDLARFVQKKLGLANDIVIMDDIGLQHLIDSGAVSDPAFKELLNNPKINAQNIRIGDKSYIYLSPKLLQNRTMTVLAIGHEIGHHLYSVAWNGLTDAAQNRLREASNTKNDANFNEWMADQLAAWITQRRAPRGAVEAFFSRVGGQIRRLYTFLNEQADERFALDETFAEFADAVAQRAAKAESPGANPLSDSAMRAWFKNEGVTMYKFFGKLPTVDNMEDLVPRTETQQQALERILKNYPVIARRAIVLRNWIVKAYSVAVAPSTSVVRDIAKRVPSARKLVSIFSRENHGDAKLSSNYHQRVAKWKGEFIEGKNGYQTIVAGLSVERRAEIARSLHEKDGNPSAKFTEEELAIRDLFDRMHEYALKNGLPVRKVSNYFPRSFSREALIANKQEILDHLTEGKGLPLAKARAFYNSLVSPDAQDGRATIDVVETPSFKNMNSRTAQDKFFDQFLDENLDGVLHNYVNSVVKRAEFNRALGEAMPVTELDARKAIQAGIWDPKAKLNQIIAAAKKEGATDEDLVFLEKYVDANLGQLGRDDIKPGLRKWMAGMMAYQNMRVLMFTVFASLPDLAGPAIRTGDMRGAFKSLKDNMHKLAKNDNDLADMARAYGIISSTASEHIMTEYVDNHHMPPKLRKWNTAFFKWTGLNWYTDVTRKMALAVGIDYIQNQAQIMKDGDEKQGFKARDRLKELGINEKMVDGWVANGTPSFDSQSHAMEGDESKIAEALIQFVDESIMRPNASQRPLLASHPGAMLVYHLKGYLYAVHEVVLKRVAFNIKESDNPAQLAAAIAPALAMMLLTAVGLELRELIQYAGSNRKPPTDRMDGWEYTWELAQRSGLTGISQLGIDLEGAEDRGLSHVAGIGGPTLSQAAAILSRPTTQTIPQAIPVVGQIPAARSAVRTVL